MYRRKFRRKRRLWFPVEGQESTGVLPTGTFDAGLSGVLTITPAAPHALTIAGLTFDFPADTEQATFDQLPSLADFQSSAWHLDSVIGNVFIGLDRIGDGQRFSEPSTILCAAWIATIQVDSDTGAPLRQGTDAFNYSCFLSDNIRDPFVWRRQWVLGNPLINTQGEAPYPSPWPNSNIGYPSVASGPHFETKSKRFIGTDERLFFGIEMVDVGSGNLEIVPPLLASQSLEWRLDYRIVGQMRSATNRRNTSR